eukprot:TRINITY_DN59071_c0_g1_i1.p1 TRINITY_DN59071_c0_g1~~TRINITY_DN59071_c0_g1_i1.p1  ORF type:complete len:367 (+),score=38.76 TRINITY_DN59071_c0_g1_i1:90-1190(+)
MLATEFFTKRAASAAASVHPELKWFPLKRDGIVSISAGRSASESSLRQTIQCKYSGAMKPLTNSTWTKRPSWQPSNKQQQHQLTTQHGLFSNATPIITTNTIPFSNTTWNARALIHSNPKTRARQLQIIKTLAKSTTLALQEVHGTSAEIDNYFRDFRKSHWIAYSAAESRAAGAVATLIRKDNFPLQTSMDMQVIILGRAILVTIKFGSNTIQHFNIHNENFEDDQTRILCCIISHAWKEVAQNLSQHAVIVTGDLNDAAKPSVCLGRGLESEHSTRQRTVKLLPKLCSTAPNWKPIRQPQYHKASETLNHKDRTFVCVPSWVLATACTSTCVTEDPISLSIRGLSDHAPITCTIARVKTKPNYD